MNEECDHDWEWYPSKAEKVCTYEDCNKVEPLTDSELHECKINSTFSDSSGCY